MEQSCLLGGSGLILFLMHPSKYHCMTIEAHLPRVWPPLGFLKADIQTNMYHWHLVTPGRCPMVPHHHDGHEPSSCEQKINHLSFVMNSAKAISLFIFFKWNRDNIKVRKYIRKNYLSWVDVILSCLFNLAQMFVLKKFSFKLRRIERLINSIIRLIPKVDDRQGNWKCLPDTVFQKNKPIPAANNN